jgi:hypothetical protein
MCCYLQGIESSVEDAKSEVMAMAIVVAERKSHVDPGPPPLTKKPYSEEEVFLSHDLSSNQHIELMNLIDSFPSVIMRSGEPPMGQAEVDLFDIELKPGALDRISKKKVRPYPLKGEYI